MPVLHRPQTVTHGGVAIAKAQSFGWTEQAIATPSMGDDDTYPTAIIEGGVGVGATATSTDADCGLAPFRKTTLSTIFQVAQGSTAKITISNAMYLGGSVSTGGGEPNANHSWIAYSADGTTTPIAITGA